MALFKLSDGGWSKSRTPFKSNYLGSGPSAFSDSTLATITYGESFSDQLVANAPAGSRATRYNITSGSLPSGLVLDSRTGVVSGTSDASESYAFTVTASNPNGSVSESYTGATADAPTWSVNTLGDFLDSVSYSDSVSATARPAATYSVSAGSLPPGISLNTSNGTFSGTPSGAGNAFSFTITATNAAGSVSQSFSGNIVGLSVEYLVVAGGGGGGSGDDSLGSGGGGGAGGMRTGTFNLSISTNYSVGVGGGGAGAPVLGNGGNGGSSTFHTITNTGGGRGAGRGGNATTGGSGGGGFRNGGSAAGTSGQGNAGNNSGGGGGKGAASTGRNGGTGAAFYGVYYAGGGAAGRYPSASYSGGNGVGGNSNASGATNRGGGGGGGDGEFGYNSAGRSGGSGVVILRYPNSYTITLGAGLSGSTANSGSDKVTTITGGSGNVSWSA
jgi:hypothetical protein